MLDMKKIFKKSIIGYSDHTVGNSIPLNIALGAKVVEKHFVIDKKTKGPDVSCSMDHSEA